MFGYNGQDNEGMNGWPRVFKVIVTLMKLPCQQHNQPAFSV